MTNNIKIGGPLTRQTKCHNSRVAQMAGQVRHLPDQLWTTLKWRRVDPLGQKFE